MRPRLRVPLLEMALVLLVVIGGIVVSEWPARVAETADQQYQREIEEAKASNDRLAEAVKQARHSGEQ